MLSYYRYQASANLDAQLVQLNYYDGVWSNNWTPYLGVKGSQQSFFFHICFWQAQIIWIHNLNPTAIPREGIDRWKYFDLSNFSVNLRCSLDIHNNVEKKSQRKSVDIWKIQLYTLSVWLIILRLFSFKSFLFIIDTLEVR